MGIYSLKSGEKLLDLFKQGQGPGEYASSPNLQRFIVKSDSLYACMKYNLNNEVFMLDISTSLREGKEIISERSFPKDFKFVKDLIPLTNGDSLMVIKDFGEGGFKRYMLHADGNKNRVNIEKAIPDVEEIDHNICHFWFCRLKTIRWQRRHA